MIGGATRVLAVLGDPVAHSRSPAMQNAALAALGLDWTYVALRVPAERLEAAARGLVALGLVGANVTLPHKEAAAALCDELTEDAAAAGAANTLCVRDDGTLLGDLTDGLGLLAALADAAPGALRAGATILGAGGTARAAASALARAGCPRVTLVARRPEAAAALARSLGGAVESAPSLPAGPLGVLVNTTPVGGLSALEAMPLAADDLQQVNAVADYAYRPDGAATPLAAESLRRGLPCVDGLELLVRQGALSLARWTGLEPPLDAMRRAARGA